jgi:hypothetical protein
MQTAGKTSPGMAKTAVNIVKHEGGVFRAVLESGED